MSDEMAVILPPYALASLMERAAGVVLDREDLGYSSWTPGAVYRELVMTNPDLYPNVDLPALVEAELEKPEFVAYLDERRRHKAATRLPVALLKDTVGRRLLELTTGEIFRRLQDPTALMLMDVDQLRKLWKEGFALISPTAARGAKDKEEKGDDLGGLTLDQLRAVTLQLPPDQQAAVMASVTAGLMSMNRVVDIEVLDES